MNQFFTRIQGPICVLGVVAILMLCGSSRAQGSDPRALVSDGQKNIWIANYGSNTVTKLNGTTGAVIGNYAVGTQPVSLAVTGNYLFVANYGSSNVTKLYWSTGALLATYAVGLNPSSVMAPVGTTGGAVSQQSDAGLLLSPCPCVWTTNHNETLSRLRTVDGLLTTVSVPNIYVSSAWDGQDIWLFPGKPPYTSPYIAKMCCANNQIVGQYSAGANAVSGVSDGQNLWVVNDNATTSASSVTKVLESTGATVGTYRTGYDSRSVAFDGTNIWVTNYTQATVSKFLASNGQALATYNVGTGPIAVIFDGTYIWVLNNIAQTVMKLQPSTGAILGTFPA
jgi:hypothetical protein